MSHKNGTLEHVTRSAKAAGYKPAMFGSLVSTVLDNKPRFTWIETERMRWDPQVQFGLRILRAPLYGVTWKIDADSDRIARWIDREMTRVYRRVMPKAVRCFEYGVAAGEVTYRPSRVNGRTRVHFHEFHEFHPRDARPDVWERGPLAGKLASMTVNAVGSAGTIVIDRQHSFWFRGEMAEYASWYGRPRLAGAFEPWLEKRGKHGAVPTRALFYKKCFRGPHMRYPVGQTNMGTTESPVLKSNQDIAREIIEKFESGGVVALPNVVDESNNPLWVWEDPKSFADVAGILDYPKQLDKEILIGLGIPPELVEASTVGSGYSGRAIPAQVFFSSLDEIAHLIIEAIDLQIIRPLVRLNFGRVGYEIIPNSMAKAALDPNPPGAGGGGAGAPPMLPGAGVGGGGGAGGMAPGGGSDPSKPIEGDGPRGGHGIIDPSTGKIVRYKPRGPVRMSLRAQSARRESRAARELWDGTDGPVLVPIHAGVSDAD